MRPCGRVVWAARRNRRALPLGRREPKLRDSKDRLLAAALELFGTHGYNSVTIDDIARRAGVTKGAFYYYFRGRGDVVADLQRALWARLRTQAASAHDPGDHLAPIRLHARHHHSRTKGSGRPAPAAHLQPGVAIRRTPCCRGPLVGGGRRLRFEFP